MLKLMGSSIILLCSTYMGMEKYHCFHKRKRVLADIHNGSVNIRNNLRCMCMPLYECFLCAGDFFARAAENIRKGELPSVAVKNACETEHSLSKDDRDCIFRFADGLCAGDCAGQLSNIDLFISEIKRLSEKAEKELETKGKLFVKGSFLAAAAVILLMI